MVRSAADERLDLIREGRTSAVFFLLLNTFPMTQDEIQLLMQKKGGSGNRHIIESIHDLEKAKYIKSTTAIKRKAISECDDYVSMDLGPYNYSPIKYRMKLSFKDVPTTHARYYPTWRYIEDIALLLSKQDDNGYVTTNSHEKIAEEILKRMSCSVDRPYVAANFREEYKKLNIIVYLQKMAVEWLFDRDLISEIFFSRNGMENRLYKNRPRPEDRIPEGLDFHEGQKAIVGVLDDDLQEAIRITKDTKADPVDVRLALGIHHFLPPDDMIQDVVELFGITYLGLFPSTRQIMRRKMNKLLEKEKYATRT